MEMTMELGDEVAVAASSELASTVERLVAVAGMLEQAADRLFAQQGSPESTVTAGELVRRLAEAEAQITALRASAPAEVTNGRKTLPVAMVSLLAKQGVALDASMESGALDAALGSLSVEQRIAVKAQLMRAGLLG